jgi:hypothetical protein
MITQQDVINNQYEAALEMRLPSRQFKPSVFLDGDAWCALYGENLMEGVSGFGDSPESACADFDRNWIKPHENYVSREVDEMLRRPRLCAGCDRMAILDPDSLCSRCNADTHTTPGAQCHD